MADISALSHRSVLDRFRTPWTITALVPIGVLILDPNNANAVVSFAVGALLGTAPYIAFAVALIAYLKAAGAEAMIARAFQGNQTRMIILAALFGGLAPFCSCEVIPFIAGLLALGAPLPAVMAFWLSSPLIDPPTLLITAAALGWPFAIAKAVSAVGLGLAGGFALRGMMTFGAFANPLKSEQRNGCGCGPSPFAGTPNWMPWRDDSRRATLIAEARSNALFLLKWLALAYALEALLVHYARAEDIAALVGGDGVLPVIIAALVGMPAYLNGYAAPPMLAGLMEQGMSSGAALSFLVAGAVSSIPAAAAVYALVKRPVFFAYLALGVSGAIAAGLIFQIVV